MKDDFDDLLDPNSENFEEETLEEPIELELGPDQEPTLAVEVDAEDEVSEDEPEVTAEEETEDKEEESVAEEVEEDAEEEATAEAETEEQPEELGVEEDEPEPEVTAEEETTTDEPTEDEPEVVLEEPVAEEPTPEPEIVAEETIAEPEPEPEPEVVSEEVVAEPEVIEEQPVAEEPAEEHVTENVIEEVKETVEKQRPKQTPKNHDAEAEAANAPAEPETNGNGNDGGNFIYKNIDQVMHDSMIPYSEFVIMDRALPRVEDGLKPVQRRIMYAMHDLGLTPEKPFRKSAGIVGECLGKYHPHGDTSVYDAMVRLAQPFNMNMPLVIGQGNFGSEDGDPPAAMRYTEAKLSHLALELLRDIDKQTVPFSLTFDDRNTEPDILPGRYPNLLTNGATGIAVGLATNIPPHNLAEVIDAHIAFIDNPRITLPNIMKIIKGPDFPTGGWVIVGEDLIKAYRDGKGRVIMRAKVHIEVENNDRRSIVITELPYQVNKVTLQKNIADLRETKKGILTGISEIRDESDRNGMRVVIKIKKEFDPREICELLFKYTNLQCNYNINMVAIAGGKPKLMGLLDFIKYYVEYQREVIYKRSVFDLENARDRAHILEGLLIAIRNIDDVVKIIKTSKNTGEARERLMAKFKLSERQAQAILDLRLARLTSLEVYKLEQELEELKKLIAYLEKLVASKSMQFDVVKTELLEIKKKYKIERRSRIIPSLADATITADDDPKPVDEVVIAITAAGTIKRIPVKNFSMSKTEFTEGLGMNDVNLSVVQTQTDKLLYIFSNLGNCYKIDVGDVPECKLRDKGTDIKVMFKDATEGERAIAVYPIIPTTDDGDTSQTNAPTQLVWLTQQGMIKRSSWTDACGVQKSNFQCYKLREDRPDTVVRVDEFEDKNTILFISSAGYILNAMTGDVPVQGRIASGVKGMALGDNEMAVASCVSKPRGFIVAVTSKGNVKRVEAKKIDKMVRYRKGLQLGGQLEKDETVVFGAWVKGEEDLVVVDDTGKLRVIPVADISVTERTGKWKAIPKIGKVTLTGGFIHRRKKCN
ncbi:MAG: DNA topoisomerase 4 subunit A [Firmicutes bacterium]|nr:DNA topoisomerase 4 subunit A [Bacillota bacterium]